MVKGEKNQEIKNNKEENKFFENGISEESLPIGVRYGI